MEKPILFSAPMVRAILDDRKTQTRRLVKWPLRSESDGVKRRIFGESDVREVNELLSEPQRHPLRRVVTPYGRAGGKLWVREAFAEVHPCAVADMRYSLPGDAGIPGPPPVDYRVVYRADGDVPVVYHRKDYPYRQVEPSDYCGGLSERVRWTPSIHMPKWASRITLDVTGVRIERLKLITEHDAGAEGIPGNVNRRKNFAALWDQIYVKQPGMSWDANPFVWRVEFRRVEAKGVAAE